MEHIFFVYILKLLFWIVNIVYSVATIIYDLIVIVYISHQINTFVHNLV